MHLRGNVVGGQDPETIPTGHVKVFSDHLSAGSAAWRDCPEQARDRTVTELQSKGPGSTASSPVDFKHVPSSDNRDFLEEEWSSQTWVSLPSHPSTLTPSTTGGLSLKTKSENH
jgi:hypothetical protein